MLFFFFKDIFKMFAAFVMSKGYLGKLISFIQPTILTSIRVIRLIRFPMSSIQTSSRTNVKKKTRGTGRRRGAKSDKVKETYQAHRLVSGN